MQCNISTVVLAQHLYDISKILFKGLMCRSEIVIGYYIASKNVCVSAVSGASVSAVLGQCECIIVGTVRVYHSDTGSAGAGFKSNQILLFKVSFKRKTLAQG